ncbi:MAG TPA: SMC-Scp complex subunit ScpB [Sphingobacteriaceae bacterium]|nr:SMC-Scp complex subunit ScpB [Sphingobacteriaceae bacterium]
MRGSDLPADLVAGLEALLFSSAEPLPVARLAKVLEVPEPMVLAAAEVLREQYQGPHRGIELRQVAGGLQVATLPAYGRLVQRLTQTRRPTLSKAALETLAVIAYRQPITRAEIEQLRGVNCERSLQTLLERNLVVEKGRRPGPGRPILYGTSPEFLVYFGLNSLEDLPALEDFPPRDAPEPASSPASPQT